MLLIRTWHTYLGVLIAPSVIFFALTGSYQLFSLHEAHGAYHPPALLEKLSMVHKDQVFARRERQEEHDARGTEPGDHEEPAPSEEHEPSIGTILLKWYFLTVAIALTTSTTLGLWMGLTHIKHKRAARWLLCVGVLIPLVLCSI